MRVICLATVLAAALCSISACKRAKPIVVGSKNFTEQIVLGEIVIQHLERRLGQPVERRLNLGGTLLTHQALITDQIDVYPEYTGTALQAILKELPVGDATAVLTRVKTAYREQWNVDVLEPLGFDNPFAMVVRASDAQARNLRTISDAANADVPWRLGVGYEFSQRPDGMPAFSRAYEFKYDGGFRTMDLGLLYSALDQKQVDLVAASATDGQLSGGKFTMLEDDKHVFPAYEACLMVHPNLFVRAPNARKALEELSGRIDRATMRRLNAQVDIEHKPVRDVAAGFLKQAGLAQ